MPKNSAQNNDFLKEKPAEMLVIEGGAELSGTVKISGAKNAVLPLMAAALLSSEECIINNTPVLDDVLVMLSVLEGLGVKGELCGNRLRLDCRRVRPAMVEPRILGKLRASNLILGPMLARFKEAEIGACGGCTIGKRPLDLHFQGLSRLGARILPLEGGYFAFARELTGAEIKLDFPSVGATENLLMAAAMSDGRTVLRNAAAEPEIVELAAFINAMGGKISGAGTPTVVVEGVKRLHGAEYSVMPDRIETGTFLLAGAMCGSEVYLRGARLAESEALAAVLSRMGAKLCEGDGGLLVGGCRGAMSAVEVATGPYPGFPTDMQPQLCAALTLAAGRSKIYENVFESRFAYINELKKLGATIQIDGRCAIIDGQKALHGADMRAGDLRAGAALTLAALAAEGRSRIVGVEYIDRGYENFVEKLVGLGAHIRRSPI